MRLFASLLYAALATAQQSTTATADSDKKDTAGIEGRTVSPARQPLRKATLTLRPMTTQGETPKQPYATTSDAEGKFVFEAVEPGSYQLWAERPGYMRQAYGAKRNLMQGTTLTLSAGQHMKDINFSLAPQAVVSGRVLDEDGDPIPRTQIRVMRQGFMNGKRQLMPTGGGMTDEAGEFKIASLAPGRYFLSAAAQSNAFMGDTPRSATLEKADKPQEGYVTTYYPGVTDATAATVIEVVAGRDLARIDIRLHKSQVFRIRGKVTGWASNQSVQRHRVMLLPKDGFMGFFGSGSSGIAKDGSFELHGVAPGSYSLLATISEGNMQILARQPVDVGNRNVDDIVLTLQPAADLHGVVRIEGQETDKTDVTAGGAANAGTVITGTQTATVPHPSLPIIRVSLVPSDGMIFGNGSAIVKDDGTFVLSNVSPGKYRVSVYGPEGTYMKSVRLGNNDVMASGFDLGQGGGGDLEILFSRNAAQIDGTVQREAQKPAQGGIVTLIPDPPQPEQIYLYHQASVDQNGHFSLKGISPGKYRLFAWEDIESGAQYDPEFTERQESQSVRVTVSENGREQVALTAISPAKVEEGRQR